MVVHCSINAHLLYLFAALQLSNTLILFWKNQVSFTRARKYKHWACPLKMITLTLRRGPPVSVDVQIESKRNMCVYAISVSLFMRKGVKLIYLQKLQGDV